MLSAFFSDNPAPWMTADVSAVTLAATNKALYPAPNFPPLGGNFFNIIGRSMNIRAFGRCTSGATPGNLTIGVLYGTGADANGVVLASSAAQAWTANQTNMTFFIDVDVHCRSVGNAGTLFVTGFARFNESAIAPIMMIPATAPAVSGACDLTNSALILSLQALRSGSTAETMQIHYLKVIATN
jgi:hypothetical protein